MLFHQVEKVAERYPREELTCPHAQVTLHDIFGEWWRDSNDTQKLIQKMAPQMQTQAKYSVKTAGSYTAKGSRLLRKHWRYFSEVTLRSRCWRQFFHHCGEGLMPGGAEMEEHLKACFCREVTAHQWGSVALCPKGNLQTWKHLTQEMVRVPCFSLTGIHNWDWQLTAATGKVGRNLLFSLFGFWLGFLLLF